MYMHMCRNLTGMAWLRFHIVHGPFITGHLLLLQYKGECVMEHDILWSQSDGKGEGQHSDNNVPSDKSGCAWPFKEKIVAQGKGDRRSLVCKIRQKEVPYVGHPLTAEGLTIDPRKVHAIQEMPEPLVNHCFVCRYFT